MRPNIVTEASLSTRARQWWLAIPCVTGAIIALCSIIYLLSLLLGYDDFGQICFLPDLVVGRLQVYRAFTAVIFHASLLHVVFNMLALVPIGSELERVLGSVRYLHVILLLATSNAIIHILIAYVAAHNPIADYPQLMHECGIGFSGVIFAMIVMESCLNESQTRSIFGFFNVPAKWYPWALLILFQLIMPRVSLLAHLSGILSGFAYIYGCFNFLLLEPSTYARIESSSLFATCMRRQGFIVGGSSGTGTASLPSFRSTSNGNGLGFGSTWSRLRSYIPHQEVPVDERFPGTGHTLGSVGGTPQRAGAPATRTHTGSELQTRLLDRNGLDQPGSEMPAILPTSTRSGFEMPPPMGSLPQVEQGDKESAIHSLVTMGFEKSRAAIAFDAAGGDIEMAIEILSSEGAT